MNIQYDLFRVKLLARCFHDMLHFSRAFLPCFIVEHFWHISIFDIISCLGLVLRIFTCSNALSWIVFRYLFDLTNVASMGTLAVAAFKTTQGGTGAEFAECFRSS